MQEDSGNRNSTQMGRPVRQSQIHRHAVFTSPHQIFQALHAAGISRVGASRPLSPGLYCARPLAASGSGAAR